VLFYRDQPLTYTGETMTKLIDYRTRKLLAIIANGNAALNKWCYQNGKLPHSPVRGGWLVI